MRTVVAVFQLCRFLDDDAVWRPPTSPNRRGLARSDAPGRSADALRAELARLPERLPTLEVAIHLTAEHHWRWVPGTDGLDVAQGIGDQDRRVRCVSACRAFVDLVPLACVDPVVAIYRRGGATSPRGRAPRVRSG